MKKRTTIAVFVFIAVCLYLITAGVLISQRQGEWYIPGDEKRNWARAEYDELFSGPLRVIPTTATAAVKDPLEIEVNEVDRKVTLKSPYFSEPSFREFGVRIISDPKTGIAVLPNGQQVRFLGMATWLPVTGNERSKVTEVKWFDPVSLDPIEDPEVRGLVSSRFMNRSKRRLILAFGCSGIDTQPIRWHFVAGRNPGTLTPVIEGGGRSLKNGVMYYSVDLNLYHDAPLNIALPICYGKTETISLNLDANDDSNPVPFPSGAAELSIVFSRNGSYNGSTHTENSTFIRDAFEWPEPKPGRQVQSLGILRIWPPVQAGMLEYQVPHANPKKSSSWASFHGNKGIFGFGMKLRTEEVKEIKVRRYPEIAHCTFHLSRIPNLPAVKNLIEVETGPIEFRNHSHILRFITGATATQVSFYGSGWNPGDFPMRFDNVTPRELLRKIEAGTGREFYFDRTNHKFSIHKPDSGWDRFLGKLKDTIFP